MNHRIIKRCAKCKRIFALGYEGIQKGRRAYCDACAGISRTTGGYIISPEDRKRGYIELQDPTTGEKIRIEVKP